MIAIERVDQVEVFVNEDGQVVVKQEWMGEESFVFFHPRYAKQVIKAIQQVAREAGAGE